jgi:hypothetical protein
MHRLSKDGLTIVGALALGTGLAWATNNVSGNTQVVGVARPVLDNRAVSGENAGSARPVAQMQSVATPVEWREITSGSWPGITTTVQLASDIVEATVVDVSPVRFNTETGGPPPGEANPLPDDDELEAEWMLYKAVTMEISRRYKGDNTHQYVTLIARGGTYDVNGDGQPEYVHEQTGRDLLDVAVNYKFFIFGVYPWTVPPEQVSTSPWQGYGLTVAMNRSTAGYPTEYLEEYAAFKVDGSTASSVWGGDFELSELRQWTMTLLQ